MTRGTHPDARWSRIATALIVVAIVLLAAPVPGVARDKKPKKHKPDALSIPYHWAGVPGGRRVIEVWGVTGNIRATHSDNETLYVDAVSRGTKTDPTEVQVGAEPTADGVRVCARYPRPSGDLNPCGEVQDTRADDVMVDFSLKVPPGATLIAHDVNGSIGGDEMQGPVEAYTTNGGITVVSTHRVVARTMNGTIDVMMGPLGWSEPMSYTTTNGSVLLRIPPYADAVLDATTHTGKVECLLKLTATETSARDRLVGTLGKGGPRLRLETAKGDIQIMAP